MLINNFLVITCDWNIPDIIIQIVASLLGAFLGFLFAIRVSKIDNDKQMHEHIKNLYDELLKFYKEDYKEKLINDIINVENIKIINLPFLERTINFNLGYTILGVSALQNLKDLNLAVEQINYIFVKKNNYYYKHPLELADIGNGLDLSKDVKLLMTQNKLVNEYIAYNKVVYDKVLNLYKKFDSVSILAEIENNKKVQKILKKNKSE